MIKKRVMFMYADSIDKNYEIKIKPFLVQIVELRKKGFETRHIAKALDVPIKDFEGALDRYDDFNYAYQEATQHLIADLSGVVFGRATGTDGRCDKDGNPLPPDEKLALELLKALDPRFRPKKENTYTFRIENVIDEVEKTRAKLQDIIEGELAEEDGEEEN